MMYLYLSFLFILLALVTINWFHALKCRKIPAHAKLIIDSWNAASAQTSAPVGNSRRRQAKPHPSRLPCTN